MQKPETLTIFNQSEYFQHTCLNNTHLTPAFNGQLIPANYDQVHWFFYQQSLLPLQVDKSKLHH
jgi:hypothetical protein